MDHRFWSLDQYKLIRLLTQNKDFKITPRIIVVVVVIEVIIESMIFFKNIHIFSLKKKTRQVISLMSRLGPLSDAVEPSEEGE